MKIDSHWRGTAEGFLLAFKEKMRLLETLLPKSAWYDSDQRNEH